MSTKVALPPGYVATGNTVYMLIQNQDYDVYDAATASTFTAITSLPAGNADVAMTEQGASGQYRADFPSGIAAGTYRISIRQQSGASPDYSDPEVVSDWRYWSGVVLERQVGYVTGNLLGSVTGNVTVGSHTAAALAEIEGEALDALESVNLDHLVGTATSIPAVPAGTYLDQIMDDGTAAFDRTTDSLQAIRDRGDAAWTGGGGGSIAEILHITPLIPSSIDLASSALWRIGLMLTNGVDDLPSTAEITPGTISIDRKALGGTSWDAVDGMTDVAMSELDGVIYFDEVFDAASGYAAGDALRITFKNQKITVAANDYVITGASGVIFYARIPISPAQITADIDANSTRLSAIETDTNELEQDWSDGGRLDLILDARASQASITALNNISTAQVRTEAAGALTDIHLHHLLAVDYDPAAKPGVATALFNELVESDLGVSRFTANALEQAPVGGGTVNANVVSILGTAVTETNPGDLSASFSFFYDVDPTTTKTVDDVGTGAGGGGGGRDFTDTEVQQIRHRLGIDGTAAAPAATPSLATASDLATVDANVDSVLTIVGTSGVVVASGSKSGYVLAGGSITSATFGVDAINAAALAPDAVTEIQSGLSTLTEGQVNAQVDTALADYDSPTMAELTARTLLAADYATAASIAALNDLSAAEVNAEVDQALLDYDAPTNAELTARTLLAAEYATATSITALNDVSTAEVNAEVDAAIVTYGLDHLVQAAVVGADVADNSIVAKLASKSATADWDTFNNTTDSLEGARDATAAEITALNDLSAAEVNAEVDEALAAIKLDRLVAVAGLDTDVTDNSLLAQLASKAAVADWTTFDNTTDSQEGIRDNMVGGDVQAIIDGVLAGLGGVSTAIVSPARTWRVLHDGQAANIVVIPEPSDGKTLVLSMDFSSILNDGQDLLGAITVTTSPDISPTNAALDPERKRVHFTIDGTNVSVGTVTVNVQVGTTDSSQTLEGSGTLRVT